jgi:hypothetical protein
VVTHHVDGDGRGSAAPVKKLDRICEASGALRRRRSPLEGAEMAPLALAKTVNIIAEKHLVILFT